MNIIVGADHRGAQVLSDLLSLLEREGCDVEEAASATEVQGYCDYPDVAYKVATAVASGTHQRGILACGSGIGMCIAANKVPGIRAAPVHDEIGAEMARRHNDTNVLCLAGDLLGARIVERIVHTWLHTEFEAGRHARRIAKIAAIEQGRDPQTVDGEEATATVCE